MVRRRDGPAAALRAADGPVLLERGGALNGGLVGTGAFVDVVGGTVAGDSAFVR